MSKPVVLTISGIRPDFIRMSEVYKKLDQEFVHILVHSGQHFNDNLSGVFFDELDIRQPDYNLGIGQDSPNHWMQLSNLTQRIFELIRDKNLKPDLIVFLGDSNSVCCALPLKKEGFKIAHIEAGMRSGDRRMLEEINRITCDHCSDMLFAYHQDYANHLLRENICPESVHVVGNTIVEVCRPFMKELSKQPSRRDRIIVDIHRPESLNYPHRIANILRLADYLGHTHNVPVYLLQFNRTMQVIQKERINLRDIIPVPLFGYKQFVKEQYNALCLISDSGTAQEEPAILKTPVLVPRDYTERPQSVWFGCSRMINAEIYTHEVGDNASLWIQDKIQRPDTILGEWLGDGTTSQRIVETIRSKLA